MRFCIVCVSLLLLHCRFAVSATYVIAPDGSGDFPTIQAAVNHAVDGDTIELLAGTFRGPGNRGINYIGKAITIRSQQGTPEICTIDCEALNLGFFFGNDEGRDSILDGITVRDGSHLQAGGIYCFESGPTIRNCVLAENMCTVGVGGGGMLLCGSSALVVDCVVKENTSVFGAGGMFCCGGDAAPTVTGCVFFGNRAVSDPLASAGAVVCTRNSPRIEDCLFYDNRAESGAGCLLITESSPFVSGCTIVANEGAGILIGVPTSHPRFENTIVALNQGVSFDCVGDAASLSCCDVWGNEGGDWVACIQGQAGIAGNFSADPLFCDPEGGDYTLDASSPCLPGNHPGGEDCGWIGAFGLGCDAVPLEETTWGRIRAWYQDL